MSAADEEIVFEEAAGDDLSALVDVIADRFDAQVYPPVKPAELSNVEERNSAEEVSTHMLRMNYVELQSFVDEKYAQFRSANPVDLEISERQRRPRWYYENFYCLAVDFFCSKALESRSFSHFMSDDGFVPLIPVGSIGDDEKRSKATLAVQGMKAEYVSNLDQVLWAKWDNVQRVAPYASCSMLE